MRRTAKYIFPSRDKDYFTIISNNELIINSIYTFVNVQILRTMTFLLKNINQAIYTFPKIMEYFRMNRQMFRYLLANFNRVVDA